MLASKRVRLSVWRMTVKATSTICHHSRELVRRKAIGLLPERLRGKRSLYCIFVDETAHPLVCVFQVRSCDQYLSRPGCRLASSSLSVRRRGCWVSDRGGHPSQFGYRRSASLCWQHADGSNAQWPSLLQRSSSSNDNLIPV